MNLSPLQEDSAKYSLTQLQADDLKGMVLLPDELRRKLLRNYQRQHGTAALIGLFAEFIGLANSVILNSREFVEMFLITYYKEYPETAEKINLPTIQGALAGVKTAVPPSKGMCHGCAFRLGSVANQCEVTTMDAQCAAENRDKNFYCHEDMNEDGSPKHLCAGYAKAAAPGDIALRQES